MSGMRDGDPDDFSLLEDEVGVRFRDLQVKFDEAPLIVSMPFPFSGGKPQSALVGEAATDLLTIKNTTDVAVELKSVQIYSSIPQDSYLLSLMPPPMENPGEGEIQSFVGSTELEDRLLQPDETLEIWLSCTPQEVGMHRAVIRVVAGEKKMERSVFVLADDPISRSLATSKPFEGSQRKKKFNTRRNVRASRPSSHLKQESSISLPQFAVPRELRAAIEHREIPNVVEKGPNQQNYAAFFSTLLSMEEIYLEEKMRGFDMKCAAMTRKVSNLMCLVVHGLAEQRPSLVPGDSLLVKSASNVSGEEISQGYISKINAEEIHIKFGRKFHLQHHDGKRYHITFSYNRLSIRKLHLAVRTAAITGSEILFPRKKRTLKPPAEPIIPFNQTLNPEQIQSVEKILACRGSPPYIIHGPPGTGKTVTLAEAILQICRRDEKSRILVCAPSNSAADHILEKLISSSAASWIKIFRLNAPSRPCEDLNPNHLHYCFYEGSSFGCPPKQYLVRHAVIVSTYVSSFLLYDQGIGRGHFDYIFLDEAGQASEPEAMVPLMGLCPERSTVVLAGDPMQLGPVVCSPDANRLGLGKSYLQRMFDFDFYVDRNADYMTKLVRNYRSHEAILRLPSSLFYGGELIACKESKKSMVDFLGLPNKEFPVLFVGVEGCDEREGSSPSWFNRTEVSKVVEMIRRLKSTVDFSESDIGVVTPYLQQAVKLRAAFDSVEIKDVKVGSVEKFQGQEMEVIILSTVRSTVKHHEFDQVHSLGFLTNPRRFNVAITHARSLLVIIGNPRIITKDPFWEKLLRYCVDNGSYQGCPLSETPGDFEWDESLPGLNSVESQSKEKLPSQTQKPRRKEKLPSQNPDESRWREKLPSRNQDDSQ